MRLRTKLSGWLAVSSSSPNNSLGRSITSCSATSFGSLGCRGSGLGHALQPDALRAEVDVRHAFVDLAHRAQGEAGQVGVLDVGVVVQAPLQRRQKIDRFSRAAVP